jgi:hypothetical protein
LTEAMDRAVTSGGLDPQPVTLPARLELAGRCRHDVEMSVEDDPEVRSLRTVINQAIVASRESLGFAAFRRFAPEFGLT